MYTLLVLCIEELCKEINDWQFKLAEKQKMFIVIAEIEMV